MDEFNSTMRVAYWPWRDIYGSLRIAYSQCLRCERIRIGEPPSEIDAECPSCQERPRQLED